MSAGSRFQSLGIVHSVESIAAGAGVQTLTVPDAALGAVITIHTNDVRYRVDGTNPSASVGHFASENANIEVNADHARNFRFIGISGNAGAFVTYYRN